MGFCLFVYGTLQPGHQPYDRFCQPYVNKTIAAKVRGTLYHLPLGYPAVVPGDSWVQGYWLAFASDQAWGDLDDYEGHDEDGFMARYPALTMADMEYSRWQTEVFDLQGQLLGRAWVYGMTRSQVVQMEGMAIDSGIWSEYRSQQ